MPHPTFTNLPEAKKQRLVTAVKTEFAEHDFTAASVERITRMAEVSKGSFYQYFHDKRDAYLFAVQDSLQCRVAMTDDLGPDVGFAERLTSILRDTHAFQRADPLSWGILARANNASAPQAAAAITAQVHEWVRSTVQDGMERGELRPDLDPDATAWLIEHTMADLGRYLMTRFNIPGPRELEMADESTQQGVDQAATAVLDMLLHAILVDGTR